MVNFLPKNITNFNAIIWLCQRKFYGGGVQGAYQSPSVELIEVKTEKGFADSFTKEEEEF